MRKRFDVRIQEDTAATSIMPHLDQLLSAAASGDVDRLKILLNDPELTVNATDAEGRSALFMAAQANQLDAVKLLLEYGAAESAEIPASKSAITAALLSQHNDIADYLLKHMPTSHVIQSQPLHQGPSQKNRALKNVEYIFHCLLGVEYTSNTLFEAELYAKKYDESGKACEFSLVKNSHKLVVAHCPNGRSYNLSLALKYANMAYFMLDNSVEAKALIAKCELILGRSADAEAAKIADTLTTEVGDYVVYDAEQAAIKHYTGESCAVMNALLRAMPIESLSVNLSKLFIHCMLAISGTNKNIHFDKRPERAVLTRHEAKLPEEMLKRMKTQNQMTLRTGLLSFSENDTTFDTHENRLVIKDTHQHRSPIANVSYHKSEMEVLFLPSYLRFTSYEEDKSAHKNIFTADIVTGVATEYVDGYTVELALLDVHTILTQPYKDGRDVKFGIARHNHASGHHVRKCILIEPVVDYFKRHAADESFRHFCHHLTSDELLMMKVMMIYSRSGRESEVSALSNLDAYMRYQRASAQNMARFMREHMHCDEATIAYYSEIMINMGNPNYTSLVTGETEEIKRHKLYINQIIAFTHDLDLPRIYDEASYNRAVSGYNGSPQADTAVNYIIPSEMQAGAFKKLESIAMRMLVATGDRLLFSKHGIGMSDYSESEFVNSNSNVSHCWRQCQIAYMTVLGKYNEGDLKLEALQQAIRGCKIPVILHTIFRMSTKDLRKYENKHGKSVLADLIQSDHDYMRILEQYLQLMPLDSHSIILLFELAISCDKTAMAWLLSDYLTADSLTTALSYLCRHNFNPTMFAELLGRVEDVNQPALSGRRVLELVIEQKHPRYIVQALVDKGARVDAVDLTSALLKDDYTDVSLYLIEIISIDELTPELYITILDENKPPEYAEKLSARMGSRDVLVRHLLKQTKAELSDRNFSNFIVRMLRNLPSMEGIIFDELVAIGYDFNGGSVYYDKVLYFAVTSSLPVPIIRRLVAHGAKFSPVMIRSIFSGASYSEVQRVFLESAPDITMLTPELLVMILNRIPVGAQDDYLKSCLEQGFALNHATFGNLKAVSAALKHKVSLTLIRALIDRGASVSTCDIETCAELFRKDEVYFEPVLHFLLTCIAVEKLTHFNVFKILGALPSDQGNVLMERLLALGFNPNKVDDSGNTFVVYAIKMRVHASIVCCLLAHDIKLTAKDLKDVASSEASEGIKRQVLLKADVDLYSQEIVARFIANESQQTQLDSLHQLCDRGFVINKNPFNMSEDFLSHVATSNVSSEVIHYLITIGCKVTGCACISAVQRGCNEATILFLLQHISVEQLTSDLVVRMLKNKSLDEQLSILSIFFEKGFLQDGDSKHRANGLIGCAIRAKLPLVVIKELIARGARVIYGSVCAAADAVVSKEYDATLFESLLDGVLATGLTPAIVGLFIIGDTGPSFYARLINHEIVDIGKVIERLLSVHGKEVVCNLLIDTRLRKQLAILEALEFIFRRYPEYLHKKYIGRECCTVSMRAAELGLGRVVSLLLKLGVDANILDNYNNSALTLTLGCYHSNIARELLVYIDPRLLVAQNIFGSSPLSIAFENSIDVDVVLNIAERCPVESLSDDYFNQIVILSKHPVALKVLVNRCVSYLLNNQLDDDTLYASLSRICGNEKISTDDIGVMFVTKGIDGRLPLLSAMAAGSGSQLAVLMARYCSIKSLSVEDFFAIASGLPHEEAFSVLANRFVGFQLASAEGDEHKAGYVRVHLRQLLSIAGCKVDAVTQHNIIYLLAALTSKHEGREGGYESQMTRVMSCLTYTGDALKVENSEVMVRLLMDDKMLAQLSATIGIVTGSRICTKASKYGNKRDVCINFLRSKGCRFASSMTEAKEEDLEEDEDPKSQGMCVIS
ncbi:MAG: SidE phosphodiesterase domain-containing protein [Coxiellaceae bacterium]|nr:SidE phosphodiesterase domain-containing protein [Coxiellaceae bacterium]